MSIEDFISGSGTWYFSSESRKKSMFGFCLYWISWRNWDGKAFRLLYLEAWVRMSLFFERVKAT